MVNKNGFCRKGLSLFEILLAAVIFIVLVGGMMGIFISSKGYLKLNRQKMVATELGKFFLDPLQNEVSAAKLADGSSFLAQPTAGGQRLETIDGRTYEATYQVSDMDGDGNPVTGLKKVKLTIKLPTN